VTGFEEFVRIESGRPEHALIEAEIARIVDDLTVRVEPDPGDALVVASCNGHVRSHRSTATSVDTACSRCRRG
jgi:hypothetical protein